MQSFDSPDNEPRERRFVLVCDTRLRAGLRGVRLLLLDPRHGHLSVTSRPMRIYPQYFEIIYFSVWHQIESNSLQNSMKEMKSASGLSSNEKTSIGLKIYELPQPVPQYVLKTILKLQMIQKIH